MRKQIRSKWVVVTATVFGLIMVTGVAVAAPNAKADEAQTTTQQTAQEHKDEAKTRLADAKLKSCQNREKAVTNIMARLADRGTKQLNVFTKISERTQEFYKSKGKTLSNYDALVTDINTKKTAAQTTVDKVKTTSVEFKCDGTDPKGAASTFKEALESEIEALKAYKTSIKNLIVGVKSAQGTAISTENKTEGGQQ